jgi:hypothetical protein
MDIRRNECNGENVPNETHLVMNHGDIAERRVSFSSIETSQQYYFFTIHTFETWEHAVTYPGE